MRSTVVHAITRLAAVSGALDCEPDIQPDFSGLNLYELPAVVLALINRGVREMDDIYIYLVDRKAPIEIEDLDEVLALYEGSNPSESLWKGGADGYRPLISIA